VIRLGRIKWKVHVARMRQIRNAYKILAGKPERKKSLMRPRHRWEDNIKIYLRETLWEGARMDAPGSG